MVSLSGPHLRIHVVAALPVPLPPPLPLLRLLPPTQREKAQVASPRGEGAAENDRQFLLLPHPLFLFLPLERQKLFTPPASYPVVGNRLSLFRREWAAIGAPPLVLRILKDGYSLPFVRQPPQVLPSPSQLTVLSKPDQIKVVDEEVAALLSKGAIR